MNRSEDDSTDDRERPSSIDRSVDRSSDSAEEADEFYRGGATASKTDVTRQSLHERIDGVPSWIRRPSQWVPRLASGYGLGIAVAVALIVGATPVNQAWSGLQTVLLGCFLFIATVFVYQAGWAVARRARR